MNKRQKLTTAQREDLEKARKTNKDKNTERRLHAILLYDDDDTLEKIALKTGFSQSYVLKLWTKFRKGGLEPLLINHQKGNHRNMSFDEEVQVLKPFLELAQAGQMVDTKVILAAYEEKLGRDTSKDHGRIYNVLKRHGWRTIAPRTTNPNKANDEVCKASKKLTKL